MPRTSVLNDEGLLREAVEASTTKAEVLLTLGLIPAGGNYKALREKCEKFGISTENLGRNYDYLADFGRLASIPDELVFCENSTYSNRANIKKRLVRDHGFEYECVECGLGDEWNGKSIMLTLEHKNGVRNDHRLENLCFLCPNCHSQTDTYAGRNLRQGRTCADCGIRMSKNLKLCPQGCDKTAVRPRPEREKITWLPTADLTALVAEHGYSKAGRILGVSDNAIRKRIRTHPA